LFEEDKEMNKEEYDLAKDLLIVERYNLKLKHKLKMERLLYERETNQIYHENEKERMRIKSAEIRKAQEWKENNRKW
jgi:hypothetical protein